MVGKTVFLEFFWPENESCNWTDARMQVPAAAARVRAGVHPARRGAGALRHRGVDGGRRLRRLLLHALRKLPDRRGDQGQGRRLRTIQRAVL